MIGAGAVGVSVCEYLLLNGACDSLVLVDLNQEKAQGEILDLATPQTSPLASFYSPATGAMPIAPEVVW